MMDIDIIYPKQLFRDFYKSIKQYRCIFFGIPIIVGLLMTLLIGSDNKPNVEGLINSSLTSFVPIFATILSVYISWVFEKKKTRHEKERIQIFQETTNAIFVLIPLVLISIGAYFVGKMSLPKTWGNVFVLNLVCHYFKCFFEFAYYALFVEISLIIFMITKRSYIIVINEIRLLEADK